MGAVDKDKFWAELEAQGEEPTREKLGLGYYGERKETYVKEWLRQKEQARTINKIEPWHKRPWGVALIAIIAGLAVAGLSYYFGWL